MRGWCAAALTRYVQKIYHDFEVEDSAARIPAGLRQRSLPGGLATTTATTCSFRVLFARASYQNNLKRRAERSVIISARGTSSSSPPPPSSLSSFSRRLRPRRQLPLRTSPPPPPHMTLFAPSLLFVIRTARRRLASCSPSSAPRDRERSTSSSPW